MFLGKTYNFLLLLSIQLAKNWIIQQRTSISSKKCGGRIYKLRNQPLQIGMNRDGNFTALDWNWFPWYLKPVCKKKDEMLQGISPGWHCLTRFRKNSSPYWPTDMYWLAVSMLEKWCNARYNHMPTSWLPFYLLAPTLLLLPSPPPTMLAPVFLITHCNVRVSSYIIETLNRHQTENVNK